MSQDQPDEPEQEALFDLSPAWTEHWRGMPEYRHEDQSPRYSVLVHIATREDFERFAELIGQPGLSAETSRGVWYPRVDMERAIGVTRYEDES